MKGMLRWLGGSLAVTLGWLVQVQEVRANAGTGWTYPFNGTAAWGTGPRCAPTLLGSNLIITTTTSGSYNQGAILLKEAFNPSGVGLCVPVYEFGAIANDGSFPVGQSVMVGSTMYGITHYGGTASQGTIYTLNTNTWVETPVHHFTGGATNGANPEGSLVLSGSTLYGMTYFGGVANAGTIFSYKTGLILAGQSRFTLLHSFAGGTSDGQSLQPALGVGFQALWHDLFWGYEQRRRLV